MAYSTKQKNKKNYLLDKAIQTMDERISYRNQYNIFRQLKLTQFLAGGSKWFKAFDGARNLQNRS